MPKEIKRKFITTLLCLSSLSCAKEGQQAPSESTSPQAPQNEEATSPSTTTTQADAHSTPMAGETTSKTTPQSFLTWSDKLTVFKDAEGSSPACTLTQEGQALQIAASTSEQSRLRIRLDQVHQLSGNCPPDLVYGFVSPTHPGLETGSQAGAWQVETLLIDLQLFAEANTPNTICKLAKNVTVLVQKQAHMVQLPISEHCPSENGLGTYLPSRAAWTDP